MRGMPDHGLRSFSNETSDREQGDEYLENGNCLFAHGAVMAGQVGQAAAAPLPTNVATMKAAAGDDVTPVYWRGRGFGWGIGGLLAGAIIGGAIASGGPYGYYGGDPYYGG